MSRLIRLIDRTRTAADWKCPRSRYWGYEYLNQGISKASTSLELFIGIITHDAMATIATLTQAGKPVPIDDIASMAFKQVHDELIARSQGIVEVDAESFASEQGALIEGMIRGFYKYLWPKLMVLYPKIVAVETEMEYPLNPDPISADDPEFIFMTKPDLVVEDLEGNLVYLEYKTTKFKNDKWINSWETAVQLHSSVKATGLTLGREPNCVQIIGLYKGYESYGKQNSPFCYAYKKNGNPPFTQDIVQYEYKAGFKRYPTWELKGGVKEWVESMPDDVLANQFPMTPIIMVNEDLVKKFFEQRLIRETEIFNGTSLIDSERITLDRVFPQKFDQCQPAFGWACEFKKLCHGYVSDPLQEGFELRMPHHEQEFRQINDREEPNAQF